MSLPHHDGELDQTVRLFIVTTAAETGHVPQPDAIAAGLGHPRPAVDGALARLAAGRAIIPAPNSTNVWAANPFCATPTSFHVAARGRTYHGICIWDALGIPAALDADATVAAACGDCGDSMTLEVRHGRLMRAEGVVHFGVPAARFWDNIAFT